jgi:hydroxyacylglutathione hydrolase
MATALVFEHTFSSGNVLSTKTVPLSMLAIGRVIGSNPRSNRCASAATTAFLALSAAFSSLGGDKFSHAAFAQGGTPLTNYRCSSGSASSCIVYSTTNNMAAHDSTTTCPASLTVAQIPCLSDNYGYLIHDATTGATAAIDTPDAAAIQAELTKRNWTLTHILNTHHHYDHTGGNVQLKNDNRNTKIYGPATEKIPGLDVGLHGGDVLDLGSFRDVQVLDVGGHTAGHIAYYFPTSSPQSIVFVGDSLFALGCGKMFEGTPTQFWSSLQRLRNLPDDTLVYCAHEYTASNAKFALSVEPSNAQLVQRVHEIQALRARGEPTVPSLLGLEKQTNPFLRCDFSDEIRRHVGVDDIADSPANAFAKVRKAKDNFRG